MMIRACALYLAAMVAGCGGSNVGGDAANSPDAAPALATLVAAVGGDGVVTSSPAGIDCGAACTADFEVGTTVTLDATANVGAVFTGWSGACSGTGSCAITIDSLTLVSASFAPAPETLTVTRAGAGMGAVISFPAGIDCGVTCSASFERGTVVTLVAAAGADSFFAGWAGGCSGTGFCIVTLDAAQAVTATFEAVPVELTVLTAGSGMGGVSSVPAGIDCGVTCTASFAAGTLVMLTATPTPGALFDGWSGACAGIGTCSVTMDRARSVAASFSSTAFGTHALLVTKTGAGDGTVTSAPAGIACGAACAADFAAASVVSLAATADANSLFVGWSGACSGAGACLVTMDGTRSVTATFAAITHPLSVSVGPGGGTIVSNPAGIYCGAACDFGFDAGTMVTLLAVPDPAGTFVGWSGACSGTGACVVTMDAAHSVGAQFAFSVSVTEIGSGSGLVTSTPAGLSCAPTCTAMFVPGTSVTLTADGAGFGGRFVGWSGACAGTSETCTLSVDSSLAVTAAFDGGGLTWTHHFGSTLFEYMAAPRTVAVDAATGDIVFGATLYGPVDLGGGLVTPAVGGQSGVIARFTAGGTLLWTRKIGAVAGTNNVVSSVAFAPGGAVVATGYVSASTDFGDGVPVGGSTHGYVAKYTAAGALVWVRTFGNTTNGAIIISVTTTPSGDAVLVGQVYGTVDFGFGATSGDPSSPNFFVARFSGATGAPLWAFRSVCASGGGSTASDVVVDPVTGDVVVGGTGNNPVGTVDLGGGPHLVGANTAGFVARYTGATGAHQWDIFSTGSSMVTAIGLTSGGNVIATGTFQATMSFGGPTVSSFSANHVFLAAFGGAGAPQWLRQFGGAAGVNSSSLAVTSTDDILLTGSFQGDLDFGGGPLLATNTDGYVAKLDPAGDFVWAESLSGDGVEAGQSIAAHVGGEVVAGIFNSTVAIDTASFLSNGDFDMLLLDLGP